MTEPNEVGELDKLREQVSELTQRVFRLEQILEGGASAEYSQQSVPYPTMELDSLVEPPPQSYPSPLSPHRLEIPTVAPGATADSSNPAVDSAEPVPPPLDPPVKAEPVATAQVVPSRPAAFAPLTAPQRPASSLESRIGGQWLNRIGIVAVLVGLSYFLKLAFENNWIGPPVRVAIGMGIGLCLLLWSERFRTHGSPGFAYSLKAIAFGAMYLSLWAAYQFYHLLPPTVAFGGMVAVTVTAAAFSLRQNSELLAAFALVGGFITPVLMSTNQNQERPLLSYLALLALGTIWVVAVKSWRQILLGSLVGTALLFAGWAFTYYTESQLAVTLAFASFFFLLYVGAPLVGSRESRDKNRTALTAFVLLTAAGYFVASYAMLFTYHRQQLALLTAAVAGLYLLLALTIWKREPVKARLVGPLYLAIGIIFLTIAIPLKLDRQWITLAWIVEAGAFFWASHYTSRNLLRVLGSLALALGVFRLVTLESGGNEPLLVNARFGLYMAAIGALALLAYFAHHEEERESRNWAAIAVVGLNILALTALHFEVWGYFEPQLKAADLQPSRARSIGMSFGFTYSAIWMIYGSALMLIGFWKRSAFVRWQAIILLAAAVIKVFGFDISELERGYRIAAFIGLGVILLAVSYFYQRSRVKPVEVLQTK